MGCSVSRNEQSESQRMGIFLNCSGRDEGVLSPAITTGLVECLIEFTTSMQVGGPACLLVKSAHKCVVRDGNTGGWGAVSVGQRGSRKEKLICTGPNEIPIHCKKAVLRICSKSSMAFSSEEGSGDW